MKRFLLGLLIVLIAVVGTPAAQFTRYTGTLTGQVGSLITALDAALVTGQGWGNTSPAAGTNKKCYRPAAGNQFYFRVDDNGTGTGGAKEALIRGAESWTDIDTPSLNPFPDAAQSALTANSLVIRKSNTADGVTRTYIIYADDRTAIIFIKTGDQTTAYIGPTYFGDFYSLVPSDGYRTCLFARSLENSSGTANEPVSTSQAVNSFASTITGSSHYVARSNLGVGTSVAVNLCIDYKFTGATSYIIGKLATPNPANGGIYLSRLHFQEYVATKVTYRGRLRGIWGWCQDAQPFADGDVLTGTDELSGKTFQVINPVNATGVGSICIETSNTLETN